jgi:hypothetical protein
MRHLLVLIALLSPLAGAACGRDEPSADERAVCVAVRRLESVDQRDEERALLDTMISKSRAAKNDKMLEGAKEFKAAVDGDQDLGKATAALTKLTDECERLGLRKSTS